MSTRLPLSPLTSTEALERFPAAAYFAGQEQRRVQREYAIPSPYGGGDWKAWHEALTEVQGRDGAYRDAHYESLDLRVTLMVRLGEW